jgi:hypothetical protein
VTEAPNWSIVLSRPSASTTASRAVNGWPGARLGGVSASGSDGWITFGWAGAITPRPEIKARNAIDATRSTTTAVITTRRVRLGPSGSVSAGSSNPSGSTMAASVRAIPESRRQRFDAAQGEGRFDGAV